MSMIQRSYKKEYILPNENRKEASNSMIRLILRIGNKSEEVITPDDADCIVRQGIAGGLYE